MTTSTQEDRVEREILVRSTLTQLAGPRLAKLVASVGEDITFAEGAVLYRAGDPAHHLYALLQGEIELSAPGRLPWLLQNQSGVGVLEVLTNGPRTFTARALTAVHATRVAADDYFDFLEERFDLVLGALSRLTTDIHLHSLSLPPDGGFSLVAPPEPAGAAPPAPMSFLRKVQALRDSVAFGRANVQALVRLAAVAREARVEEGGTVFRRGEADGRFYLVTEGVVQASREAPAILATFGAGELVCGYGAIGPADDEYVATACTRAAVLVFEEEDFFDVMEEHFELTRSVLAGLARDFERLLLERERRARLGVPI